MPMNAAKLLLLNVLGGSAADTALVYGASWDKGSSPALTRTDDAVGMVANAGVDMTPATNDFDTAEIFGEIFDEVDDKGNVFRCIPTCYIAKTDGVGFKTWRVSKKPFAGSYLPACFWDFSAGKVLPYIAIGAHNASLDGSNRLESKPDKFPLVSRNIAQMRGYAQANGPGYQQLDVHVMDLLKTLFYIEFATLNSQAIMRGFANGRYTTDAAQLTESGVNRIVVTNAIAAQFVVGQTIGIGTSVGGNQIASNRLVTAINDIGGGNSEIVFDGATVNITATTNYVYSLGWKSGFRANIAASSGSLVSNSTGKRPASYRGIENPWGNIWQFVDGVNVNDNQAWVCADADNYTSNLFTAPYESLSYVNHNANGWATAMGWDSSRPHAEFPVTVGGNDVTYYSDYYYQSIGQRISLVGGFWYDSWSVGVSFWSLYGSSGYAGVDVGARLIRKPV